jgi:tetratricopeptide (TPR) repeat protein
MAYLKSLPTGAVNLMALADDLYTHEKYELALAVYERVLGGAADEDKPWLLFQIANCRRHTDVPQAAMAAYGRVVSECPKTLWADLAAAQVQLLQWRGTNDADALLKAPAKAQGSAE